MSLREHTDHHECCHEDGQTVDHQSTTPSHSSPRGSLQTASALVLEAIGEDLTREGLLRTPERYAKAMEALCAGYKMNPKDVVGQGVFAAEGQGLVTVKNVEFYSLCEHHMLPFWGHVSVAYFPSKHIVGLSKIPRLVEIFARRFQVQERLTRQVADALQDILSPRAIAIKVEARHLCMMMRGVRTQDSETRTEYVVGLENLSQTEKERLLAQIDMK
jgi:GTP cyclohydrolase I